MKFTTIEQAKEAMAGCYLPAGERRSYYKCKQCQTIMIREYIPYATGMGRTFNACLCYLTGNDKRNAHHELLDSQDGPIDAKEPPHAHEKT